LSATAERLLGQENDNLRVFLSERTLEWDIARAENWDLVIAALRRVRPRVAQRVQEQHAASSQEERADALLEAVKDHKGRFAQALLGELHDGGELDIPPYLREAIEWLTEPDEAVDEPAADSEPATAETPAENGETPAVNE
jgi:hypothetical protein